MSVSSWATDDLNWEGSRPEIKDKDTDRRIEQGQKGEKYDSRKGRFGKKESNSGASTSGNHTHTVSTMTYEQVDVFFTEVASQTV